MYGFYIGRTGDLYICNDNENILLSDFYKVIYDIINCYNNDKENIDRIENYFKNKTFYDDLKIRYDISTRRCVFTLINDKIILKLNVELADEEIEVKKSFNFKVHNGFNYIYNISSYKDTQELTIYHKNVDKYIDKIISFMDTYTMYKNLSINHII